ncbi:MAG: DUF4176 domain-containing protein [Lachnospiraceae bacterium]|nr:DUF4176 domain-containing protein [Lachnospiraceae bacterium]
MDKLLALGTVVRVNLGKGNTASLMIAGYYPRSLETGEVYEYLTVMYPFGMTHQVAVQMIHADAILAVEAEGYMDETAEVFTTGLPEMIKKTEEAVLSVLKEEALKTDAMKAAAETEEKTVEEKKAGADPDFFV